MPPHDDFDLHAFVVESRRRQGLPPKIENPVTLERIAAIFRFAEPGPATKRKPRRAPPAALRTRASDTGGAA